MLLQYINRVKVIKQSQGANVNQKPAWLLSPYFALPTNGVSLMSGQTVTIYGDALINVPIINNLNVSYVCNIGTPSGNNLVINPAIGDVGDHSCAITFRNGINLIGVYTINLFVYAAPQVSLGAKNILMVSDSLLELGNSYYKTQLDSVLSNHTLTYLGTQGTTVKHEGYGGWAWYSFISAGSPFFKSGALNIAAYFTDNAIAVPDYVSMRLGVNDTFPHCNITGDKLTDAEITAIINNAKTLINGFLTYNASLKILLSIPTICENSGAGWNANYDESVYSQDYYIENMHKYWSAFVAEFASGVFNSRVECTYESILLDRNDGYPKTGGVHTNGVHLSSTGYLELGQGMALGINKVVNKFISANIIPLASSIFETDGTVNYFKTNVLISYDSLGKYMTINANSAAWSANFGMTVLTVGKTYGWSASVKSNNYTGRLCVNIGLGLSDPIYTPNITSSWVAVRGKGTCTTNGSFTIIFPDAINGSIDFDNFIIQEVRTP